ncbi:MKRN2 ligase, partial [Erythrocercus mccallii]|nr:MKRN2 ligase [Erythrocercus mccallii]
MERVYGKALPGERLFGILPNCSHAYCVGCIRKWRCSRAFENAVKKGCPECRTTSSYYIPHQYWISDGDEKEELIRTFKARTGKIPCKFFIRGHCPFNSECIYLHDMSHMLPSEELEEHRQMLWLILPPLLQDLISSSSESSDEEDE